MKIIYIIEWADKVRDLISTNGKVDDDDCLKPSNY